MPKTKISEFSATPANNTDIDSINIAEGCAPSGINDAIRELMAQLKDFQTGAVGDSFNGPVGTTTAAAGAFTTLSSTGNTTLGDASGDSVTINGTATFANANPTLSAGTANGVAYLNGSKVVTSGSALTFDGTNFTVGASATTGDYKAFIQKAGGELLGLNASSGTLSRIAFGNATASFGSTQIIANASDLAFITSSAEQMRLTSTGLGIGTSSPSVKLDVRSGATPTAALLDTTAATAYSGGSFFSGANLIIRSGANATGNGSGIRFASSNNGSLEGMFGWVQNASTYGDFVWQGYNGSYTERMRLDSSGNLGLGVSPSAWATSKAIQVGNRASLFSFNNATADVANNAYFNGSDYKYIETATATFYRQNTGSHSWYTAPSGTAGNAITFTQAMTLDSSGNLLVGATSAHNFGIPSIQAGGSNANAIISVRRDTTSSADQVLFYNPNGNVGGISTSGSATTYSTSSDYRLKNITGALTGYKERLMSLQPKQGTWITDGSEFRGFLAHEFAQPYRASVTGEKDAVNAEGKPIMQGMQASSSEVMADLVALVKEQQAIIESLKARLDAANL